MKQVVLSNIPFKPDRDGLLKKLHMDAGSEDGIRFLDLIRQAEKNRQAQGGICPGFHRPKAQ